MSNRLGGFAWAGPVLFLAISGLVAGRIVVLRPPGAVVKDPGVGAGLLAAIAKRPVVSIGFRNLLSDVAWLDAVQVAGNPKMTMAEYDRLFDLLNVTSDFDPRFEIPYLLGGLILGESPLHARKALAVLERGKRQYPADWRFPFYMGYTEYFSLGDAMAGGAVMAEAAALPGSPAYLTGLASRMLSEAREPDAAIALLEPIVRQESDPARRAVMERRIREVYVERDLQALEKAVERYREKTGAAPVDLSDLVREGVLPAIPVEPNGGKYLLVGGGKVRSDRIAKRLQVFRKK